MIGELVKRAVNLAILGLAVLAFFTVPLGERTLFEHLSAIVATKEAKALGKGVEQAGKDVEKTVQKP